MEGRLVDEDGEGRSLDRAVALPQLIGAVAGRRWWIIIPTAAAFAVAAIVVIALTPRYTGVAKILLENQESYYTRPEKAASEPAPTLDPEAVQSEAETITSPDLARQAIAKLDLVNRPEFNQPANVLSTILTMTGLTGPPSAQSAEARMVETFLSRLTAFPVAKTRVLQIEFVSEDPELAARGANAVAQLFLEAQESAKKNAAKAASAWLAARIDELRSKVADSDAKVENYRAQSGLLAGGNNMTVPAQQLAELNTQLGAARTAQSEAQAKAQLMRSLLRDGRLLEAPDIGKDESLRRYAEQRVALKAQIASESRTLLPGHPHMKELAAQLDSLDGEIRVAIDKAARGLENDARLAAAQVANLNATLAAQSKVVASGNVDEVELHALELDAKAARDQLESYVQKYREAIARDADNAAPADARVISVATAPRSPTFPKKIETLALGTLTGLLLSTGAVVSQILLAADPIAPVAPVAPVLEAQPVAARRPEQEAEAGRDGMDKDEERPPSAAPPRVGFLTIGGLAACLLADAEEDVGMVALVAAERSDDSASPALALARQLSARRRAVLVDLEPTRHGFADAFDRDAPGMAELMAEKASFGEVIQRDPASALDVICAGRGEIAGEDLDQVLAALAASYAFIVVHVSDWRSDLALAAIDHVDRLIIVAPIARLRDALPRAREAMGGDAEDVLGLVAANDRFEVGRAA